MGRKRFIGMLLLLSLAGVLVWEFFYTHEPRYEGRPLSFWLDGYMGGTATGTTEYQADQAMQAIGTNAIPTLLNLLRMRDSRINLAIVALLQRQNLLKFNHLPAAYWNDEAIRGFEKLRAHPELVLPELLKCLRDPEADVRVSAAHSLGTYGAVGTVALPAVPALTNALEDPDWRVRSWSLWALRQIDAQAATNAVAALKAKEK